MRSSMKGACCAAALAFAATPGLAVTVIDITGANAANKVTVQTLSSGADLTNSTLDGKLYLFDEGTTNGVHSYLLHYLRTLGSQDQYHVGSFTFSLAGNETFDFSYASTQATLNATDKAGVTYATTDENRGLDCCGSGLVRFLSPFGDSLDVNSNPIKVEYNLSTSTGGLFTSGTDDVRFFIKVGSVPEPASWAMMVVGFGLSGFALRSRRKAGVSFA